MSTKTAAQLAPSEFLSDYPENLREIAEYLRDLVRSTFPGVVEKVYTGWRVIGYRLLHGTKSTYFCCIAPQKKENDVLLGFEYGIAMKDPQNLMEGKGTQVRFVRIRQRDEYLDDDLIWLIVQGAKVALALRTGP
ncbi:DUF1801 domain-containing protein [bacterium]|nr:DUF1801 domain-containing protein [bacterium]MCI0604653.1 DUF1801 domain-containing protein [bacterium]